MGFTDLHRRCREGLASVCPLRWSGMVRSTADRESSEKGDGKPDEEQDSAPDTLLDGDSC